MLTGQLANLSTSSYATRRDFFYNHHYITMSQTHNLKHIAFIMDGNRRWAMERGLPKLLGHTEGMKNLHRIAMAVLERSIPFVTVYALSTENLKNRGDEELKHLFSLFNQFGAELDELIKRGVRIKHIGYLPGLPAETQKHLVEVIERSKNNTAMTLTLAINYGGKDEMARAVQEIGRAGINSEDIDEEVINAFIDTAELPEVDLLIRTAGEQRLSNFLLWRISYAELYFTPIKWPAFNKSGLDKALAWFEEQKRNFGK